MLVMVTAFATICCITALWLKSRTGPFGDITRFSGKSANEVIGELGKPASDVVFKMSDFVPEARIELLNFYPDPKGAHANVSVRECIWHGKRYNLAIWFHLVNGTWHVLHWNGWKDGFVS